MKAIKQNNSSRLLEDLGRVSDVMVYAGSTGGYLKTTKRELLEMAKTTHIKYALKDTVYKNRRVVMVIY